MGLDARKLVFGGLRTTKAQSDQRLCYSIIGNTEYTLLTTIAIASPGLHVIFNIELKKGQNVNRPVTTLGNVGDDAALLRLIDANITSFDKTCDEIFRRLSQGKQTSSH